MPSQLEKWQTNGLFEAIQQVGLDPNEFDLKNDDSEVRVKHKLSMSHFTIVPDPSHYVGSCVVGDGADRRVNEYSWQSLIKRLGSWLEDVKRDLETPDMWAELQRSAQPLFDTTFNDISENTSFTGGEQSEITARLKELAEHVRRTYSLSAEQTRTLDAKLEYLVDASHRLGRKDWVNAFVGAILGWMLIASLPSEAVRGVFLSLLRTIDHLYGVPLPLLP